MTAEELQLIEVQKVIGAMSSVDREKVRAAASIILAIVDAYPDGHGMTAVALVGASLAAQE